MIYVVLCNFLAYIYSRRFLSKCEIIIIIRPVMDQCATLSIHAKILSSIDI